MFYLPLCITQAMLTCQDQYVGGTLPTYSAPLTFPLGIYAAVSNVSCTARENDWLGDFSGFPDS